MHFLYKKTPQWSWQKQGQDTHTYGSWHDSEFKSLEGKSDHFDSLLCD